MCVSAPLGVVSRHRRFLGLSRTPVTDLAMAERVSVVVTPGQYLFSPMSRLPLCGQSCVALRMRTRRPLAPSGGSGAFAQAPASHETQFPEAQASTAPRHDFG